MPEVHYGMLHYIIVHAAQWHDWNGAGSSVDQHFLTSYHHAILKVVLSQFTSRGFSDGMEGIVRLVQASPYLKASQKVICTFALFVITM